MSCHSQVRLDSGLLAPVRSSWETGQPIAWNRVNDVPDHVHFEHSIHITKGVGCESCHGRTDEQTVAAKSRAFYMTDCLDCHENPAKYLRPRDQVTAMGYQPAGSQAEIGAQLVEEYNVRPPNELTNCSICHR
jgi:cytochrome c553